MNSIKSKVISGIFWQYAQRLSAQIVQFIVSLILARLLLPKDFGTIAIIGVFITISNLFIDSGFGNALIQKKNIDDIDCSSVFYLNLIISIILYAILFCSAPYIASFYELPILTPLLRVQALLLIVMAFTCVQNAILVRNMEFKKNFIINISAVALSSIVGVVMAYTNCGVWSLVLSQLTMQITCVIGYWSLIGWRPKTIFSWNRIKSLYQYSSRIFAGSLLNILYNNIYNIIIGKQYSAELLGYYNRGVLIPTILVENGANTLNSVMFPALASMQDEKEQIKIIIQKMVKAVAFIVFLLIAILMPLAEPLVSILLTDRWLQAVPFLRIACITVCFSPFILINTSILTSLGYSNLYLKATSFAKMLAIGLIFLGAQFNIYIMVAAGSVGALFSMIITSYWNKKLIKYSLWNFIIDITPPAILAIITGIGLYLFTLCKYNQWSTILIGGTCAIIFYSTISYWLKLEPMDLFIKTLKSRFK